MIELTEKFLNDAGGWQAMKHARSLADAGRVMEVKYLPPSLTGTVREGEILYRAGLKIFSRTHIENLCTCRESQQWGKICAHSLATGLALIRQKISQPPVNEQSPEKPESMRVSGPSFAVDGAGEQVILHIILPPNFASAWEKGTLTVGIEARVGSRRMMLNALEATKQFRCDENDWRVLEAIRTMNGGALAGMLMLPREKFLELLESLRGHPRVTFGKASAVDVKKELLKPVLNIESDHDGGTTLRVELPPDAMPLIASRRAWFLRNAQFQQISPELPVFYFDLLSHEIKLDAERTANFCAKELPMLRTMFEVRGEGNADFSIELAEPEFSLLLEGSLNHLTARLQAIYDKRTVTIGITSPDEQFAFSETTDRKRLLTRNVPAETVALERLMRWGFRGPDKTGHFTLNGNRAILAFFANEFPKLQRDWIVSLGARFTNVTRQIERIHPRIDVQNAGEDWFELRVSLDLASGERFSEIDIQQLLKLGRNGVRLKNGKIAVFDSELLDELNDALRDCEPQQIQPGLFRISRTQAGYLDSFSENSVKICATRDWRRWAGSLRQIEPLAPVPLGSLEDILRPYQKQGVYWLHFLARNRFGGILADEMGLGKTLQALTFLSIWMKTENKPALVVCPSSLVFNWQREAEKFTKNLKVICIDGTGREALFSEVRGACLAITSYALLRRDIDRYRGIEFSTVILDEAQHIKNPDTQNAQAAATLRSMSRFVLTGTPIENSVRDLWSLMNFAMPGYLGNRDDFRERYEFPILKKVNGAMQQRLKQRLQPFLLRRRKVDVLKEIPEKIEQITFFEINEEQNEVYNRLLNQGRTEIEVAEKTAGRAKAQMVMLTVLLRLRQACCDLRLLGLENSKNSAKLDLAMELIKEAIDGGHKILLFSQFVSMLRLIGQALAEEDIQFCILSGETKNREAEVDRFQTDPNIRVFLISLKAGGVGLNLTAADIVLHFDPWWNPATENQATDRAHRLGQRAVVTSYKLIARNTVEEKILRLQQRKQNLTDATLDSSEESSLGLSGEELWQLLYE